MAAARSLYPVSYDWVPTERDAALLEKYSSVWTPEDWENRKHWRDFSTERCNAIQELARTRLFLADSIYLISDVDDKFLAPSSDAHSIQIRPTGFAEDPLARRRRKPTKPSADIVKMLTDAKARADAEQAVKQATFEAEYAKRCEAVRIMNGAILAEEERKWRQASAPPSLAENLRSVTKPPQPSWEEWQAGIVYLPVPSRATVQRELELAPFLERYKDHWCFPTKEQQRSQAEADLAMSKARMIDGPLMPGLWHEWEVEFIDPFIQWRMEMVPY